MNTKLKLTQDALEAAQNVMQINGCLIIKDGNYYWTEYEKALSALEDFKKQGEPKHLCSICEWTNTGCWNLGEPGKPRWVCQGCSKRVVEKQDNPDTVTISRELLQRAYYSMYNSVHSSCHPKLIHEIKTALESK